MLFRDVISLIITTTAPNSIGDSVETPKERQVFADKQSIRQTEFYQAAASGLRPEIMFIVRSIEYNQEKQLKHNQKTYDIIRTFDKDNEFTELVCRGSVNAG